MSQNLPNGEQTYTVILKPVGVELTENTETHEFTFTTSDHTNLETQATEQAHKNCVMDPVSLRQYWEIAAVARNFQIDTPETREFKEKATSIPNSEIDHFTDTTQCEPLEMNYYDFEAHEWSTFPLLVVDRMKQRLADTYNLIDNQYVHQSTTQQLFHEAVIHTAIDYEPGLADKSTDTYNFNALQRHATANYEEVAGYIRDIKRTVSPP